MPNAILTWLSGIYRGRDVEGQIASGASGVESDD